MFAKPRTVPRALLFVFSIVLPLLFAGDALAQTARKPMPPGGGPAAAQKKKIPIEKGAYVSQKYYFSLSLPKGFVPLPEEEVKKRVMESSPLRRELMEKYGDQLKEPPIYQTRFEVPGEDPSLRVIIVNAPLPPPLHTVVNSPEELEKASTPEGQEENFEVHARKAIEINHRPAFLIDREFLVEGTRFRQLLAYVKDYMQAGYLLIFQSVAADFDLYENDFMKSLLSFRISPPPMPNQAQAQQGGPAGGPSQAAGGTPAWRSLPVIGSVLFVAAAAVWFLLRRLSAGAKGDPNQSSGGESSDQAARPNE